MGADSQHDFVVFQCLRQDALSEQRLQIVGGVTVQLMEEGVGGRDEVELPAVDILCVAKVGRRRFEDVVGDGPTIGQNGLQLGGKSKCHFRQKRTNNVCYRQRLDAK